MLDVTVVVPNFNGIKFLDAVLKSLEKQENADFEVILVDNGSTDGSADYAASCYPWVRIVRLPENRGFSGAVNEGIRLSKAPYVILLNNDTEVEPDFVRELLEAVRRHPRAFSCQARMLQFYDHSLLDGAGDFYCALGWAFARGKGKPADTYLEEEKIFSSCAGAAIYRKRVFDRIGLFDEEHFAYLEDMDIGYRARLAGYENWYAPAAVVYHIGSGTSGSRYNQFKVRYSSRNNVYMILKNMPFLQILLNLPLLIPGFAVKLLYFTLKGYGREYAAGIKNGLQIAPKGRRIPMTPARAGRALRIQKELWKNIFLRFC